MPKRFFFCLALLFSQHGLGFEISGNFWDPAQATFHVGIAGTAPSGALWSTAFKRAMTNWSTSTNFLFLAVDSFKDPCINRANDGFGDDISSINFTTDICGTAFNSSTIAITKTSGPCLTPNCDNNNFRITQSDILFRNDENWDIYSGTQTGPAIDFERVALHELGHVIGLRHENTNPAIMQSKVTNTHTLQIDDINGANTIYPGNAAQPPATAIHTIYGISVVAPGTTHINGPGGTVNQSGTLSGGDASLGGKFIDVYQFTFANDTSLDLQLNSSTFDPFLYLVRITATQDGVPAYTFSDDNSGIGFNAKISTSIQAGTYWVGVSSASNNKMGNYDLALDYANSNPTSSFQSFQSVYGVNVQINPNPTIVGTLSSGDFALNNKHLDLYQFNVTSQTNLRFDLSATAFDTVLVITRLLPGAAPEMQEIDSGLLLQNDNFGSGPNSRIEQSLPPGTYWIGVTSASTGQTGDYRIETTVLLP